MKNTAKKAVILNNFSSPYISEAIIILKDYDPCLEGKIISDAEKIVSAYIAKQERIRDKELYASKLFNRRRRNCQYRLYWPHIHSPLTSPRNTGNHNK